MKKWYVFLFVLCVLALVVFGLFGLRGIVGEGIISDGDTFPSPVLSKVASAEEPLTNIDVISLEQDGRSSFFVSFYSEFETCVKGASVQLNCQQPGINPAEELEVPAPLGSATTLGAVIEVESSVASGMYDCTVEVICVDSVVVSRDTEVEVVEYS